ncbi:MAG: OPT/YSL family transporter [Myxococcota bacterium]
MSDAARPYREVTPAAVILGVFLGAIMTMSFAYIGLKLGFGLPGSTVAAILGFAVLRGAGRRLGSKDAGSIVENNINQTVASGINTASSGVVFTFPALLLLGADFEPATVIFSAMAGSFMGIVVIIPLRKQMLEIERLRFPSGVAVATILKTPGAGAEKAKRLAGGFAIAVLATLATNFHLMPETWELGAQLGALLDIPDRGAAGVYVVGTSLALSMANFGAGLLAGRGGLAFAVGGVIAWWLVGPYAVGQGWLPGDPSGGELFAGVYFGMLRPVGIGVLIGGALISVVLAYPALKGAIQGLRSAAKLAKQGTEAEELSPKVLGIGYAASFVALLVIALMGTDPGTALALALAGTLWRALAGLIVAQATGATDISPLSGLALIAVTIFLAISGNNVVLAITLGVAVCVATNQCADMMQDLKTGHLIGGIPRRQQLVQFGVAWIGPAIAVGTVLLLWQGGPGGANGFGPGTALPAPQAGALEGMVNGIVQGDAPLDKYFAGAGVGAALSLFPIGGLGVLIGLAMYLPFEITFGYGIGCVASTILVNKKGRRFYGDWIVPVGAGFIVGEALTSLTLTLIKIVGGGA